MTDGTADSALAEIRARAQRVYAWFPPDGGLPLELEASRLARDVLLLVEIAQAAEVLRRQVVFSALREPIVPTDAGLRMFNEATSRFSEALSRLSVKEET